MSAVPTPSFAEAPLPAALEIVPLTTAALDEVLAIENRVFPDPWSRQSFTAELEKSPRPFARVARLRGAVVGYLFAWFVLDEVHLGNLAVHPDHRRQGIGRALLAELVTRSRRRGSSFITLEVRARNAAAIALYSQYGFRAVAVRKGYYAGRENAVIMECDLQVEARKRRREG
jgi:[ribosomal protein S18]-alanine N-acetyltransferase